MRGVALLGLAAAAALGQSASAQPPRPTVDVYVRGQAGLPPSSARGEIEVVEVGRSPLDKVLSIVGHRVPDGWRVSYVCAQSPGCDPKKFMLVKEFDLPAEAARRVEAMLERLKAQPESAPAAAANPACGQLAVAIDDRGFKHGYRRACAGDQDLTELETLLKAGLP
ncbi:MAG: hypothetical protein ACXU82_08035 [Caulobacteraceae bacterium]